MQRFLRSEGSPAICAAVAGLVAALAASPALAATNFTLQGAMASFTLREWLLSVSLLLLVVALIARLMRRRTSVRHGVVAEEAPDLRWWRNPIAAEVS